MLRFTIAFIALSIAFGATADGIREFPVGTAGILQIDTDDGWRETPPPSGSLASISMESKIPGRLQLLLTPIPRQRSDSDLRELVQQAADQIGPDSVEKMLALQSLRGAEANGYYFKAADPAPQPGEFRFLYQGVVSVGPSIVTFTILFNGGAEKDAESALSAVRRLRLVARSS